MAHLLGDLYESPPLQPAVQLMDRLSIAAGVAVEGVGILGACGSTWSQPLSEPSPSLRSSTCSRQPFESASPVSQPRVHLSAVLRLPNRRRIRAASSSGAGGSVAAGAQATSSTAANSTIVLESSAAAGKLSADQKVCAGCPSGVRGEEDASCIATVAAASSSSAARTTSGKGPSLQPALCAACKHESGGAHHDQQLAAPNACLAGSNCGAAASALKGAGPSDHGLSHLQHHAVSINANACAAGALQPSSPRNGATRVFDSAASSPVQPWRKSAAASLGKPAPAPTKQWRRRRAAPQKQLRFDPCGVALPAGVPEEPSAAGSSTSAAGGLLGNGCSASAPPPLLCSSCSAAEQGCGSAASGGTRLMLQHAAASTAAAAAAPSLPLYGRTDHMADTSAADNMLKARAQLAGRAFYLLLVFLPFLVFGVALLLLSMYCTRRHRAGGAQLTDRYECVLTDGAACRA